jgi:tetratricopeptide (TPR) repeat protein
MTSRFQVASLLAVMVAMPLAAQEDRVFLTNGTTLDGVRVTAWDVRSLKYTKGGSNDQVATDQIAKVELKKFADVYRRGLRDPDMMVTTAREQLKDKDLLLAQLGFVGASAQFFDQEKPQEAIGTLDELVKAIPEAGVVPEVYRQKFEYYMGRGSAGVGSALTVAKKYVADAGGGAWPGGLGVEAEFFQTLAERKDPKDFQTKMRGVAQRAAASNPVVASRANVELAHSLREAKDLDGAQRLYEEVVKKEGADASALAGAYLGLGRILLDRTAAGDTASFKKAMLYFLRVRLETKDAWPSLQAEALYHAILAAEKWRGPEFGLVVWRCKRLLSDEFSGSDWDARAKQR